MPQDTPDEQSNRLPLDDASRRDPIRSVALPLLLLALSVALYVNTLDNDFVIDDVPIVRDNPLLRSWHGVTRLLHSSYWEHMKSEGVDLLYRPVTMLSFAADYAVAGQDPRWYHGVNVLLNAIVVLLVFLLVSRLSGNRSLAFIAAALFAVLPCHVEAVALVVGRADLLAVLFGLSAWFLYLKGGRWCYLLSLPLLALALLSKENAIVFPVLILTAHIAGLGLKPNMGEAIRRFLGYGTVSGLCLGMRHVVLGALTSSPMTTRFGQYSWLVSWPTMGRCFFELYFRWLLLGTGMNPAPTRDAHPEGVIQDPVAWVLLGLLVLGVVAIVVLFIRSRSLPAYGGLFFFIAIAPTSNFFIRIASLAAVRFLYLPSIGYCLAAACFLHWLERRVRQLSWAPRLFFGVAVGVLFCTCAWLTVSMNACFESEKTVYRSILRDSPQTRFAIHGLALALSREGQDERALAMLENLREKDSEFDAGIEHTIGVLYTKAGRLDEAEQVFRAAIAENTDPHMLSDLHVGLGNLLGLRGNTVAAKHEFMHAVARNYNNAVAHNNLANILYQEGCLALAERHFRLACGLNPGLVEARRGLGTVLVAEHRYQEAIDQVYLPALEDDTLQSWAYAGLGRAYLGLGEYNYAEAALQRSLELERNNLDALTNLAALYLKLRRFGESIEAGERALLAGGEDRVEVIYNLAFAYEATDRSRALALWKRCMELTENIPRYSEAYETAKRRIAKLEE